MRVLIADDHAIFRKGLKQLLQEEYPFAEIDEAGDAEELVNKSIKEKWDVIITDLSMPGRSGLDALQHIKQALPDVPVLILSMYPEDQYAIRILKAGAAGYLNKDAAQHDLIKAVQKVMAGKRYISAAVADKIADSLGRDNGKALHELLSDREFDVMKLLSAGKSVSDIASMMSLSVTTISTYRARILTKMGMTSNADLTKYALENKLI
ncbi:MAG: response regulator transcription factor [Chitinophagaceae bacterium]|nr:response regulator transcription factor [Chitinophagaceae bacterium]